MIEQEDLGGLALAASALSTASLVARVRRNDISIAEMREIIKHAHAVVNAVAGFVADAKATRAANDFLAAAEALADTAEADLSTED